MLISQRYNVLLLVHLNGQICYDNVIADVGPLSVLHVVISRKLSKIDTCCY